MRRKIVKHGGNLTCTDCGSQKFQIHAAEAGAFDQRITLIEIECAACAFTQLDLCGDPLDRTTFVVAAGAVKVESLG